MPDEPSPTMAPEPVVLEKIEGQPRVSGFLADAVRERRVSHAYLFVGAPGSGQMAAATALAKCLVCPTGGCGSCDECIRVSHGTHPDVHVLQPESVVGYMIDQVRALVDDVSLTPVRAKAKVYILDRAELLKGAPANALLKTIEEPPEGVVFILISRSVDAMLPTIVSRCQVVPFRVVSPDLASGMVARRCGEEGMRARIALDVAGTPEAACGFLSSSSRRDVRRLVVRALSDLSSCDLWDVLVAARGIVEAAKVPLDDVRTRQAEALEADSEFLSPKAMKAREQRNKRELSARERSGMMEAITAAESLLRDVLMQLEGTGGTIVNGDMSDVEDRLAATARPEGVLRALEACTSASDDLAHNVSPQLTMEVMLCSIKEALSCPSSSR